MKHLRCIRGTGDPCRLSRSVRTRNLHRQSVAAKEIGIRRVLGASASSVVALLSKDFLKLVIIAILIAWPVAYYAADSWLQNFAYRVDVGWWTFALSAILALGIALLTVSWQAIRAARANPADVLRHE